MLNIGCHLSASKGYYHMGQEALSIGANTFAFFTRNPRGGKAKAVDTDDMNKLIMLMRENNFAKLVAHSPYTLNAASADEGIRKFANETFADDLRILDNLPGNFYNFHPGSHVGQGVEVGIDYICEMLNNNMHKEQNTTVLLETMAGKGSEIGRSFEELRTIIDKVELKDKIGVCLDTCHIFDGGYDIVNSLDEVILSFDKIVGISKLCAIHINDSMNALGSHKDRHQKIGEGNIGIDAFARIVNHPKLRELPFILETPNELEGYKKEIELLRSLQKN